MKTSPELAKDLASLFEAHAGVTFPLCALAVLHQGRVVVHQAWGQCESLTASTETLFDIASLSKLFTATAFLAYVSRGKLGLDDPLVSVLPGFGLTGSRAIEGGQDPHSLQRLDLDVSLQGQTVDPSCVTFRHLLTHTSGLPAWRDVYAVAGPVPLPPQMHKPLDGQARWAKALPVLYHYPFIDRPGRRVVYSDIGLMLLGHALEVISGLTLEQVIQAQVLDPLGLSRTLFNPVQKGWASLDQTAPTEFDRRWRQRRVWGEVHDENACALGGVAGHAGLFSTAMDVAVFGQAWLSHPQKMGVDVTLAALATSELACTDDVRRGLGFVIKSEHNASAGDRFSPQTFGHTGFTGTTLWVDPDRQCVVACLTNGVYAGRAQHAPHAFRRRLHDLLAHSLDAL
jgi:CubicO group peptidase (beta-lactamase class C family)